MEWERAGVFLAALCLWPVGFAWPATSSPLSVEVRNSEVWVLLDGQERRLTNDHKTKTQAALSPAADKVAYFLQCPQGQQCTPSVVILDLGGHQLAEFEPISQAARPPAACASIVSIRWVGNDSIAAECHLTPSSSEYIETNLAAGQVTRDLFGGDFTPSPNRKQVAHVAGLVHSAPPYAQSNYLQLDTTTIYPLPEGTGPAETLPEVVRRNGSAYTGIHEFMPGLAWSPDSRHVALIDCTFDWTPKEPSSLSAADGRESNRSCSAVVVSRTGRFNRLPLAGIRDVRLSWQDTQTLLVQSGAETATLSIP